MAAKQLGSIRSMRSRVVRCTGPDTLKACTYQYQQRPELAEIHRARWEQGALDMIPKTQQQRTVNDR